MGLFSVSSIKFMIRVCFLYPFGDIYRINIFRALDLGGTMSMHLEYINIVSESPSQRGFDYRNFFW